jgi:hypothetical protein
MQEAESSCGSGQGRSGDAEDRAFHRNGNVMYYVHIVHSCHRRDAVTLTRRRTQPSKADGGKALELRQEQ